MERRGRRVCQFLRSFNDNYDSDIWDGVGGKFDEDFNGSVKRNEKSLHNYLADKPVLYADKEGQKVDVYHMGALMSGLYHESSWSDGDGTGKKVKFQFMPEYHLNNLAGWAGDLQTLMNDVDNSYKKYTEEKTYSEFYDGIKENFLKADASFASDDLYADTDGHNIYRLKKCDSLKSAFKTYYKNGYSTRFLQFSNAWSKKEISELVYKYTKEKFMGLIPWPLFNGHSYSKSESKAARDYFVQYIVERCEKEDKKEWKKIAKLR